MFKYQKKYFKKINTELIGSFISKKEEEEEYSQEVWVLFLTRRTISTRYRYQYIFALPSVRKTDAELDICFPH